MSCWSGISASSAGATILCPPRLALPQVRTSSKAADRGTALHEFARICIENPSGRDQALLDIDESYRETAAGMNLTEAIAGLKVVGCERAYALDVKQKTVRFIGTNINRKYNETLVASGQEPLGRYDIPFSIDVEASWAGSPVELDFKSGQSIGDPGEHWQRRICAAGLMLFYGTANAISRVAYIRDDGSIDPDGCEFSIFDAEDFCDTLVKAIDAVAEAKATLGRNVMPTLYPSDAACQYCPAMTSCPVWTNTAKAMLGKLAAIENGPELSALSLEELGRVWELAKMVEKIVEPLLKGLKLVAAETPLPIGDAYEVRPQVKSRSYFNDSAARGLITMLLGQAGHNEGEIASKLATLKGKTEYNEFRKVKK